MENIRVIPHHPYPTLSKITSLRSETASVALPPSQRQQPAELLNRASQRQGIEILAGSELLAPTTSFALCNAQGPNVAAVLKLTGDQAAVLAQYGQHFAKLTGASWQVTHLRAFNKVVTVGQISPQVTKPSVSLTLTEDNRHRAAFLVDVCPSDAPNGSGS
jgi:hypothetical protein